MIMATVGQGDSGDIAIDDLEMTNEPCSQPAGQSTGTFTPTKVSCYCSGLVSLLLQWPLPLRILRWVLSLVQWTPFIAVATAIVVTAVETPFIVVTAVYCCY